jgi:GntR family transcriptional regulator/MocR family aminotransferase
MQGLDRQGRVVYLGTFSRSIAPAIRVAYLILPPALLKRYRENFPLAASTVSRFEQESLRQFLVQGLYGRHLRRVGNLYRKKCARLTQALSVIPGVKFTGEQAGLHFLLTVPELSEDELVRRASARSIRVHPLSQYCHRVQPLPSTLVLGYAGLGEEELDTAAKSLAEAFSK